MPQVSRLGALIALLVCLSACGYEFRGATVTPPQPAPDFTLTDYTGKTVRLSDLRGNAVLLYFGYTLCPDLCPLAVAHMATMRRQLGSDASQVQTVFITFDPDRDTADVLKTYLTIFDPTMIGLRGTSADLAPLLKAYGVTAERKTLPNSALGYVIDHSAITYIIDRAGRLRVLFPYGLSPDDLTIDVRYLINERN